MDLEGFFNSHPGLYLTQSFLHALLAVVVGEIAMRIFGVHRPASRQRIFFVIILFPVLSYPLYRLADPARNTVYFRLGALFDSARWLNLDLWGTSPAAIGLLAVFAITSLTFLFQELLPILSHLLESRKPAWPGVEGGNPGALEGALGRLPAGRPDVVVLEDDEPVIFSTTGAKAAVYLSTGLLRSLGADQLTAALAHEFVHVSRSRRPFLLAVFLLRAILFFNPVVLLAFRRAVQEDEKICDEAAVSLTGDPQALAGALRTLYLAPGQGGPGEGKRALSRLLEDLEKQSHRLNVESRIACIERGYGSPPDAGWAALAATVAGVAAVGYFVV